MCFDQCVHVDITEELIQQALQDERNLARQKGENNPTTNVLSKRRDFVGSLGQNAVFLWFENAGIEIDKTPYFNPNIHDDKFDFVHRGTNDVKSKQLGKGWGTIYPRSSFIVSYHQKPKPMDWYTFVGIDLENNIAHIAGVISASEFWDKCEDIQLKIKSGKILAKDLMPFRNYVFAT